MSGKSSVEGKSCNGVVLMISVFVSYTYVCYVLVYFVLYVYNCMHKRTIKYLVSCILYLITCLSGMNERIEAISRNTRNTQIHKTSGSVEVGKGLQETVTDGEEKDKL